MAIRFPSEPFCCSQIFGNSLLKAVRRMLGMFLVCLLLIQQSLADELAVTGFGTLGYSHEDEADLGFLRDSGQRKDPALDGSFLPDSSLGLQLTYAPSPAWRGTIQTVYRSLAKNDLDGAVDLAFIGYQPNLDTDIRLGRVAVDMFKLSDFRRVDYANLWVRPPVELYSWILPTSIDGGDIAYSGFTEGIMWRTKVQFGSSQPDLNSPDGTLLFPTEFNKFYIGTVTADFSNWRTRLSYAQFETQEYSAPFLPALEGVTNIPGLIGQDATALYDVLSDNPKTVVRYSQAAVSYDDGRWVVDAEVAQLKTPFALIPEGISGYLSLGRRVDQFTPYILYAQFTPYDDPVTTEADWTVVPNIEPLRQAAVGTINGPLIDQSTLSMGARWDIATDVAIKLQLDQVSIKSEGYALWAHKGDRAKSESDVTVFSASLNFLF